MQIGKQTLEILKNFSGINPSIVLRAGNEISTMSIHQNIIAYATVPEEFPVECGVYDLNNFIATINLFQDADIEFSDEYATIKGGNSKCTYAYSEKDVIASPKRKIEFPKVDIEFDLSKDTFDRILKAASTLSLNTLMISVNEKSEIFIRALDLKNPNSNHYDVVVGTDTSGSSYKIYLLIDLLKMSRADYKVSLSRKLISRFQTENIDYFVALEKSSEMTIVDAPVAAEAEDEDNE